MKIIRGAIVAADFSAALCQRAGAEELRRVDSMRSRALTQPM